MGRLVELPFGLATSVGDLPFTSPGAAVELALSTQPSFPTVPSSATSRYSLLAQAVSAVVGLRLDSRGMVELPVGFDSRSVAVDVELRSESFEPFEIFLRRIAAHRLDNADQFVGTRIGVLGPISFALALRAAGMPTGEALGLSQRVIPDLAAKMLARYRSVVRSDSVVVVMAEPGLVGAMHPTFPLAPSEITAALIPTVDALDTCPDHGELLIGIHVSGRTDWPSIIGSGVSLISAPADDGMLSAAPVLNAFLDAGGSIAWGAVPVDQPLGDGEELFWRRLGGIWCSLVGEGMDPFQLRASSLVGPSDGLGNFGDSQVVRALGLVDSLSVRVRRQAIGTRLSLGA
ncbi:MAG: hypothetical protein WBF71_10630 [Microthrixaceae bacterium]